MRADTKAKYHRLRLQRMFCRKRKPDWWSKPKRMPRFKFTDGRWKTMFAL